jgi:hypothetical protein
VLFRQPGPPAVPDGIDIDGGHEVVATVLARSPSGGWLRPLEVDDLCRAAGIPAVPVSSMRSRVPRDRTVR